MTNQALPRPSRELLESNLKGCQNLGLILDKYVPERAIFSGKGKGAWLKHLADRREQHVDIDLMVARQQRWLALVRAEGGTAFAITTKSRLAIGIGIPHVLQTKKFVLERNISLPYIPGTTVKGVARAWALIEIGRRLGISIPLNKKRKYRGKKEQDHIQKLNKLDDVLASFPVPDNLDEGSPSLLDAVRKIVKADIDPETEEKLERFRCVFGAQGKSGAVSFLDAIYYGQTFPTWKSLNIEKGWLFAFGLLPRRAAFKDMKKKDIEMALGAARDWLRGALTRLGAGGKTAAGYGFFNGKSLNEIV